MIEPEILNHPSVISIEDGKTTNHYIVILQINDLTHAFTIAVHPDGYIPYTSAIDNNLFFKLMEFEDGQQMYTDVLKMVHETYFRSKVFCFPISLPCENT